MQTQQYVASNYYSVSIGKINYSTIGTPSRILHHICKTYKSINVLLESRLMNNNFPNQAASIIPKNTKFVGKLLAKHPKFPITMCLQHTSIYIWYNF